MLDVWNDRQRPKLPNPDAPVVCWQYRWEFERLLMLYCDRAPTSVLELGSYMGGTLFFWLSHGVSGACAVSVDVYCKPEDYPGDVPEDYDRRYLYESWCAPGVSVVAIKGSTADRSVQEQVQALGPYD
jgi:cephalosporin hydroxylase